MEYKDRCRVCLETGDMKSLFVTNCLAHIQMTCAQAITNISSVSIGKDDGLPQRICKRCLRNLKIAYKFKILCEDSNGVLLNSLKLKFEVKDKDNTNEKNILSENNESLICNQFTADSLNCMFIDEQIQNDIDIYNKNNSHFDSEDNINTEFDTSESSQTQVFVNMNFENEKNIINEIEEQSEIKLEHKELNDCQKFKSNQDNEYSNSNSLNEDLKLDSPKGVNFCDICQKTYRSEYKHNKLHSKDKEFQCEICSKVFLRNATLRIHLLTHRDELPFRCSHPGCDKAFPLNSRLRLHAKVHTNERNFICQYCSHAARDKQQLNVHIRYFHTKEKNFLCGECGKAFVSTQARYYHTKRHQNVRNHHCPHCDKSFLFAFALRGHMATHTGEKRFGCSICDAKFSRKEHKEKHESRLHGIDRTPARKLKTTSMSLPLQSLQG